MAAIVPIHAGLATANPTTKVFSAAPDYSALGDDCFSDFITALNDPDVQAIDSSEIVEFVLFEGALVFQDTVVLNNTNVPWAGIRISSIKTKPQFDLNEPHFYPSAARTDIGALFFDFQTVGKIVEESFAGTFSTNTGYRATNGVYNSFHRGTGNTFRPQGCIVHAPADLSTSTSNFMRVFSNAFNGSGNTFERSHNIYVNESSLEMNLRAASNTTEMHSVGVNTSQFAQDCSIAHNNISIGDDSAYNGVTTASHNATDQLGRMNAAGANSVLIANPVDVFPNFATFDLTPATTGPLIDAGIDATALGARDTDFLDNPLVGSAYDIGAIDRAIIAAPSPPAGSDAVVYDGSNPASPIISFWGEVQNDSVAGNYVMQAGDVLHYDNLGGQLTVDAQTVPVTTLLSSTPRAYTIYRVADNYQNPITSTFTIVNGDITTGDATPDAFSLNNVTDAIVSQPYESNVITVTGIDTATSISVTNGEYAVSTDGGVTFGAYTSTPTTVNFNDQVRLRANSASIPSSSLTVTLSIGGVSADWVITTASTTGDNQGPAITVPGVNSFTVPNGSGGLAHDNASLIAAIASVSATDETAPANPAVTNNLGTLPDPLPIGSRTIVFSSTDAANNTTLQPWNFSVVELPAGADTQAPSISSIVLPTGQVENEDVILAFNIDEDATVFYAYTQSDTPPVRPFTNSQAVAAGSNAINMGRFAPGDYYLHIYAVDNA